MKKVFPKRLGLLIVVLFCLLILVSACGQSGTTNDSVTESQENAGDTNSTVAEEDVKNFYDKVQFGQTKEEVDALLGVTPTSVVDDAYDYVDENGNGVTVIFYVRSLGDPDPKVALSKRLIGTEKLIVATPDDQRITDEQAEKITEGMTYDEIKAILGQEGIEVSSTEGSNDLPEVERYWIKNGISMLSVTFEGPNGSDVSKFVLDF